ncbi:hypothetical protein DB346_08515 [Verrucomicrobia bacterium LW23]|nr:hypothetical protein DB346_08515 [Verrucomicrobia bacterium LW23]
MDQTNDTPPTDAATTTTPEKASASTRAKPIAASKTAAKPAIKVAQQPGKSSAIAAPIAEISSTSPETSAVECAAEKELAALKGSLAAQAIADAHRQQLVKDKIAAGLTKEQAEQVARNQLHHDAALAHQASTGCGYEEAYAATKAAA